METLFCGVLTPLVSQFALPVIFVASSVSFLWAIFYFAIVGEYSEQKRNMSKALMIWSISSFVFMALAGWLIFMLFGWAGYPTDACRWS